MPVSFCMIELVLSIDSTKIYHFHLSYIKRDSVTKCFASCFFHESVSPQPQWDHFKFFGKLAEIFASQGAPPVSTTPATKFSTSFTSVVDTGGKFATGVNNDGGKFAIGVNGAGGKVSLVTTTPAANLPPV
jgi:hypothetical protein